MLPKEEEEEAAWLQFVKGNNIDPEPLAPPTPPPRTIVDPTRPVFIPFDAPDAYPEWSPPPPDPRRALGARPFKMGLIWHHPDFTLPPRFEPEEIPSFERGAWLRLCTHRYVVISQQYPKTPDEQSMRAELLKIQLLGMMGLREWPVGEEPTVAFPKLDKLSHTFVDIRFRTQEHHDLARHESPYLRFGADVLKPFVRGAFIDPVWWVVQFSHPTLAKKGDERLDDTEKQQLQDFGKQVRQAVKRDPCLSRVGQPMAMWLVHDGYPHNPELENGLGLERRPEYTLLLKKTGKEVGMPHYLKVVDRPRSNVKTGGDGGEREWDGYVKLWWDGKPADLCVYCKDAVDGHTDQQCTRGNSEDRMGRELKPRPTWY